MSSFTTAAGTRPCRQLFQGFGPGDRFGNPAVHFNLGSQVHGVEYMH